MGTPLRLRQALDLHAAGREDSTDGFSMMGTPLSFLRLGSYSALLFVYGFHRGGLFSPPAVFSVTKAAAALSVIAIMSIIPRSGRFVKRI